MIKYHSIFFPISNWFITIILKIKFINFIKGITLIHKINTFFIKINDKNYLKKQNRFSKILFTIEFVFTFFNFIYTNKNLTMFELNNFLDRICSFHM